VGGTTLTCAVMVLGTPAKNCGGLVKNTFTPVLVIWMVSTALVQLEFTHEVSGKPLIRFGRKRGGELNRAHREPGVHEMLAVDGLPWFNHTGPPTLPLPTIANWICPTGESTPWVGVTVAEIVAAWPTRKSVRRFDTFTFTAHGLNLDGGCTTGS
jgi:hypothetical protein